MENFAIVFAIFFMGKTVGPNLNRAEIFDRINLKRTGNELAPDMGKNIEDFRDCLACLLAFGQSAFVVIVSMSWVNIDMRRSTSCA